MQQDTRQLVISQLSYNNTLLTQIDSDLGKIISMNPNLSDPLTLIDNFDYNKLECMFIDSLYQRTRVIIEQTRKLIYLVNKYINDDSKLKNALDIHLKSANNTLLKIQPFYKRYDYY